MIGATKEDLENRTKVEEVKVGFGLSQFMYRKPAVECLLKEIERLRAGRFTEEEYEVLYHQFSEEKITPETIHYRDSLGKNLEHLIPAYPLCYHKPKLPILTENPEEVQCHKCLTIMAKVEHCCECGEEYPRLDLLKGHIYCKQCREAGVGQ